MAEADQAAGAAASASRLAKQIELFGIPIDLMRRSDIERRIVAHLNDPANGLWHIATLNPEYVVAARRDPAFRNALLRADYIVSDGIGVTTAAHCLCSEKVERVTGVDMCASLFELEFPVLPRVFLLGNSGSIADLQARHPRSVVGRWGGGSSAETDDRESIERIRDRRANVILVGYGAPGQVNWIERNRAALADAGVKLAIGVGGALDFAAGTVQRAPESMRRMGLEWAYRLVKEPWRWRRQLALPVFVKMSADAWVRNRLLGDSSACRILAHDDDAT